MPAGDDIVKPLSEMQPPEELEKILYAEIVPHFILHIW